jgi:hypothetical protein
VIDSGPMHCGGPAWPGIEPSEAARWPSVFKRQMGLVIGAALLGMSMIACSLGVRKGSGVRQLARENEQAELPATGTLPETGEGIRFWLNDSQTRIYYGWLCTFQGQERRKRQDEAQRKFGLIVPCDDDRPAPKPLEDFEDAPAGAQ